MSLNFSNGSEFEEIENIENIENTNSPNMPNRLSKMLEKGRNDLDNLFRNLHLIYYQPILRT